MFKILSLIFVSALLTAVAPAPISVPHLNVGEYAFYNGSQYKIFKIIETEGLKLSSDCKVNTGKMKCQAYTASTRSMPDVQFSDARITPASQLCSQLNGKNFIAFGSKKEELNYCQFADGSLVNSWSLFYKFFPKNTIK